MTKKSFFYQDDPNRPDYHWLNDDSRLFLQRGYLLEGDTAENRIAVIADYAEAKLGIAGFAEKFKHYMARGYFSLSSPIWANFGNDRGLPISCFGSYIGDSVHEIMSTVAEVGMMSKIGGGTSGYFGDIRPRGSSIKNNGKSDGSFNFSKLFDTTIDVISQGAARKGQFAGYIDIDHGDIEEWLDIHTEGNPIQLMYYGVCVSSQWLYEMRKGDQRKRNIWAKLLQRKTETGIPYIFFTDNANAGRPDVYKDKNMVVHASNLCVAGNTNILTKEYGHTPIKNHVGEKVTVWNGEEWSENVELVKTNTNQKLTRVVLSNGKSIEATAYHKWYVQDNNVVIEKRTAELKTGDILETYTLPNINEALTLTVVALEDVDGLHDTYCCTEPKRHKVIFNGVMTGNCTEIMLPSSAEESFVCCLSSMNLLYFDEWKDTDAPEILTYFLDAVMSDFVEKSAHVPFLEKAHRFAERHRALGLGVLGWHSFLQSKMIAFDSKEAMALTHEVFALLQEKTLKASKELAERFGEPEILKGYGRRNTTLMSIAPTKSSSFILGSVSPSIEPFKSNYYVKDLAKIKTVYKNPFLERLVQEKGLDTPEFWSELLSHDGSIQTMTDRFTEHERNVFKTFSELSQLAIIQQAAARQHYIDQGQSLNIMVHPATPAKELNQLYLTAEELGIKSIYYQHSMSAAQVFNRNLLVCSSCEA